MRIVWHGHACFEVQGKVDVLTDPHDGKSLGIKTPGAKPDLVLVSHDHFDHNCTRVLHGNFLTVREPGEKEVRGVRIMGVEAAHDEASGSKRGKVVLYRFELDGMSFLHCGDLGEMLGPDKLKVIGKVDVLFIPVGGVFTIDGRQAKKLVQDLKPKVVIPMHYRYGGLALSIQTVDAFLEGLPKDKVHRVGNEIDFIKDDLPKETEYWVFSP